MSFSKQIPQTTKPGESPMRSITLLFLVAILVQPSHAFTGQFQGARTLDSQSYEITATGLVAWWIDEGERTHSYNKFGLRAAYGLPEKFYNSDILFSFERAINPNSELSGINIFALGPKISIKEDRLAFFCKANLVRAGQTNTLDLLTFRPTLLATFSLGEKAEISPHIEILWPYRRDVLETFIAFGIGSEVKMTETASFRPEINALVNPGESGIDLAIGIGLTSSGP